MHESLDARVRLAVLTAFLAGDTPATSSVANALGTSEADVRASFGRLAAGRAFVLRDGAIRMAAPFAGSRTDFSTTIESGNHAGRRYDANCVWDALGIAAMLGGVDATVHTTCADCSEPLTLTVRDRQLVAPEGVVHFLVPAAKWWDDIGFT